MDFKPTYCPYCGEGLSNRNSEGRERLYCEVCERFIWRTASPVSAVIVRKRGEVLLIKRGIKPGKGKWSLPAGFLEYEEDPEKAASRELEEETGLRIEKKDLQLVGALNMERLPGQRLVAIVYETSFEKTSGEIKPGSDAEEASFWRLNELRNDEEEELRTHFIDRLEDL